MTQYSVNPEYYSEEEITEIKRIGILDTKIAILMDILDPIQVLMDQELKFDLETKISQKIGRLIDKV
jgi:hypothetical protein